MAGVIGLAFIAVGITLGVIALVSLKKTRRFGVSWEQLADFELAALAAGEHAEKERILGILAQEICQDCKANTWPNETHRLCWLTYYNIERLKQ